MSDSSENQKYKWTPESTSLLVSVWSDKQVQKQLEYASKPQLIWESVARYMKRKGYNVTAKQCRSRMKQVLVCYREAKRAGTRSGVEQYYECIDNVLKNRRLDQDFLGLDTVDSTANMKSPPKEMKTSKNLQKRYKYHNPIESNLKTEALSPTWIPDCDNDYPDSPESNETVIARPYGMLSPTRDVAINTREPGVHFGTRTNTRGPAIFTECPTHHNCPKNLTTNYPCCEIPYQNTVQNVQNQIIQENMQQHMLQQNHHWNHLSRFNNIGFQHDAGYMHNIQDSNPIMKQSTNERVNYIPNHPNIENVIRHQNILQQNGNYGRAMPQEPRKIIFGQNLPSTYKSNQDNLQRWTDSKENGSVSPDYSTDVAPNLNDAFCQTTIAPRHNLNETYNRDQIVQVNIFFN